MTLARGTREWVKADVPIGGKWWAEYALHNIGSNLAIAGALEFQYRLGRAHSDFERVAPRKKRSIVSG